MITFSGRKMATQAKINYRIDEKDILVILYPNSRDPESLIIIDPYDRKVSYNDVSSMDEVRQVLIEKLPFCSQWHSPIIHGRAIIISWKDLPSTPQVIQTPEDIEKLLS
jgi:hypothetical protein